MRSHSVLGVEVANVDAVDQHRAVGGVEQAGDEADERALAGAGAADDRRGLSRQRPEADVAEHRCLRAGVGEADVAQLERAARPAPRRSASGWCTTLGSVSSTSTMRSALTDGAGRLEGDEGRHHDRHQDDGEVAEEGHQRPDRHVAAVDETAAEPDHRHARAVHDRQHDREHERHQPTGSEGGGGEVGVDLVEAFGLLGLADERPHHADADDLLPQHVVDPVDARLHEPEPGDHPRDDDQEQAHQHGHADEQEQRQGRVLAHRHDDAAHQRDRRRDGDRARPSPRASAPVGCRW